MTNPSPGGGFRPRRPLGCALALIVVTPVVVLLGFVGLNLWAGRARDSGPPVRMVAVATPVAGGTDVEVAIEPSTARPLPAGVTLGLPDIDDGTVDTGTPPTTKIAMRYTGLRIDGRQVTSTSTTGVLLTVTPTDRRRLVFGYHVDAVAGRRVVFLPPAIGLDLLGYTYSASSGRVDCQMSSISTMGRPRYDACRPGSGRAASTAFLRRVRLELPGS